MPTNSGRSNAPPLSEIERTSVEYHKLAASVKDRLAAFHRWLNELPGKVYVSVWRPGDQPDEQICVAIGRASKDRWGLKFGRGIPISEDEGLILTDVDEVSLADKCLAISLLPDLLTKFYDEQRLVVERLQAANDVFAQLPPKKGGQ